MIQLQDIKNASQEQIVDLLLEEKEQPFEIYIPKSSVLNFSERSAIAQDYLYWAYCGELLKEASDEISYEMIDPADHSSICFEIKARDFERVAEAILMISYDCENVDEDDEEYVWGELIFEFADQVETGKLTPFCEDLMEVYNEFSEEEVEAEEDEDDN